MPENGKTDGRAKAPIKLRELKSPRQLLAVKKITEIIRNSKGLKRITLGRILRESGFSDSMSEQPSRIIQSKSFQKLLDRYLPDDVIAEVHGDALEASELNHYIFPASEDDEMIKKTVESIKGCKLIKIRKQHTWKRAYFWSPDTRSRLTAIAEAYRVKGKYPAEKHEHLVAKVEIVEYR